MFNFDQNISIYIYLTSLPIIFLFAFFAILRTYLEKKNHKITIQNQSEVDEFLSAKKSQPFWRISYGLFASCLGAWVLFSLPSFSLTAGYIGLIVYSLLSGISLFVPSFFGPKIQSFTSESACSLVDFVHFRFGKAAQVLVAFVMLYMMGVSITAEFTAIGKNNSNSNIILGELFEDVAKANRLVITISVFVLTCAYTTYGGLAISIKTDQQQGICIIALFCVIVVYVACTFQMDFGKELPKNLSANEDGFQ